MVCIACIKSPGEGAGAAAGDVDASCATDVGCSRLVSAAASRTGTAPGCAGDCDLGANIQDAET